MSAKKRDTALNVTRVGSEPDDGDAYASARNDNAEFPSPSDEHFARGIRHDGAPAQRGRARGNSTKRSTSLRLDSDVLAYYRATGSGWQSRINEVLREAAQLPPARRKKA